ncbi:substrate-binding periplasmic protein [Pseudomonas mangiferae]|uniref:Amino acid ABC transporter substrate-binding protein n=1 Tax=Pseudomonas mangiferae TaxID=2593654 RepID=A0A553GZJ0_9PSED|nr:transporter substrate-binding domain-containing protein [Pseudomonas mangiferae]TRX74914.1 amino acid ABC transporter substrate-binding protein [Pseudomonas mangiferae]
MRASSSRKRSLVLLVLGLLPVLAVAAERCERIVATGNPEYPPYLWRDPHNPQQLIGANADLLARIASEIGVRIDVIYTGPWSRAQEEVRNGRIDLVAGAFLTLPRLETMDFVHPAMFVTPSVVWVRYGSSFAYSTWRDLRGHLGGTLVNNSFGQEFDRYAKDNLTLETVPSLTQAYQKLMLERTEYVLYELYPGLALAESMGMTDAVQPLEPPISSEGLYLALSQRSACNEPWLRGQLAKKMTELTAAGVPETLLQRNLERWRSQHPPPATVPNQ